MTCLMEKGTFMQKIKLFMGSGTKENLSSNCEVIVPFRGILLTPYLIAFDK